MNYIGINAIVLNEETGERMGSKAFDTYNLKEESQLLQEYLQDVTVGRIVCIAAKVYIPINTECDLLSQLL